MIIQVLRNLWKYVFQMRISFLRRVIEGNVEQPVTCVDCYFMLREKWFSYARMSSKGRGASMVQVPWNCYPLLKYCWYVHEAFSIGPVPCSWGSSGTFLNVIFFCLPRLWFYLQWIGGELERSHWKIFLLFLNVVPVRKRLLHFTASSLYGITTVCFYYRNFPKD